MTREELNEQIEELEKIRKCVSDVSLANPALLGAINTLKDIRDNGITDIKYTVQVIKGDEKSFLNQMVDDKTFCMDNDYEDKSMRTRFTQAEIEEFKQRDDLAIDWDKAIISQWRKNK